MGKRALGVFAAMMFVGGLFLAAPAFAGEADEELDEPEHTELPSIDEIGTQSERAQEFFPEEYEQPSVFPFMIYPLMLVGGIVIVAVLVLYLVWQPRFSEERKEKSRR